MVESKFRDTCFQINYFYDILRGMSCSKKNDRKLLNVCLLCRTWLFKAMEYDSRASKKPTTVRVKHSGLNEIGFTLKFSKYSKCSKYVPNYQNKVGTFRKRED